MTTNQMTIHRQYWRLSIYKLVRKMVKSQSVVVVGPDGYNNPYVPWQSSSPNRISWLWNRLDMRVHVCGTKVERNGRHLDKIVTWSAISLRRGTHSFPLLFGLMLFVIFGLFVFLCSHVCTYVYIYRLVLYRYLFIMYSFIEKETEKKKKRKMVR